MQPDPNERNTPVRGETAASGPVPRVAASLRGLLLIGFLLTMPVLATPFGQGLIDRVRDEPLTPAAAEPHSDRILDDIPEPRRLPSPAPALAPSSTRF